jgi:hypothetical protein
MTEPTAPVPAESGVSPWELAARHFDPPGGQPPPPATGATAMPRTHNPDRWQAARTLADLGALTVAWLSGEIESTPVHMAPPMPETVPLIPVLIAANRAGFITTQSQPGESRDEHGSAQRANVSGFASGQAFARLMAAAADSDLIITAARASSGDLGPFIVITLDDGEEFTWDGGALSREEIEYGYGHDCPQAIEALCSAWQVTLIDPDWGRNDVLWPVLERFASEAPHG